jgi:shikimate dehydrogenase
LTLTNPKSLDACERADDLLSGGVLSFARKPAGNPQRLDVHHYTLPLIEHDYPAMTATMWNEAYRAFGIEAQNCMLVGSSRRSGEILKVLRRDAKYLGGGAGVGFKDAVIEYLDELDEAAEMAGSVNFLVRTAQGKLRGYNTDGAGYARSLEEVFRQRQQDLQGKRIVMLGAGGTASSVAFVLAGRGAGLVIVNRTPRRAEDLAGRVNRYFRAPAAGFAAEVDIAGYLTTADAVVNVSTKGSSGSLEAYSALAPAELPTTPRNIEANLAEAERLMALIPKHAVLSDVVLGDTETPFLRAGRARGFITMDGVPMVVNQGVEAFWILHGAQLEGKGIAKDRVAEVMSRAAAAARAGQGDAA